jgi:tRNA U54 and U55 pseudouridine synthase Pus10
MSQTDHRMSQPKLVNLALDAEVFNGRRELFRNRNLNKEAALDYWEAQVNGESYRFTPDGDPIMVPEGIAKIILNQAQVWALAKDENGNLLMREDYSGDRISLIKTVGEVDFSKLNVGPQVKLVEVEKMKCAFCKKTFEDHDEFLQHTKGHMKDRDIEFGELGEGAKPAKGAKQVKEEEPVAATK